MKNYIPVGGFEGQTGHCPTYVARLVLDEVRDYFHAALPEAYAARLAARAERVFARQPFWQKKYQSATGREYLLCTMRHWLAGVLAKEKPALFRQLPDDFKVGRPLPEKPCVCESATAPSPQRRPASVIRTGRPRSRLHVRAPRHLGKSRFVHGSELLAL